MNKNILTFIFPIIGYLFIVITTQNNGLGITHDSVSYLEVAQNFSKGKGIIDNQGTLVTRWPPLYSITLSYFCDIIGLDILAGARYFSGFLMALLFLLFNLILKKFNLNIYTSTLLNVFLLLSPALHVFLMFWSEGLFTVLLLFIFYLLLNWIDDKKISYLLLAGFLSGGLCIIRFAGLGFLGGFALFLLFNRANGGIKKRLTDVFIFSSAAVAIIITWPLYIHYTINGNPAGRDMIADMFSLGDVINLVRGFVFWLLPLFYIKKIMYSAVVTIIVFLLFLFIVKINILKRTLVNLFNQSKFTLLAILPIIYILFVFVAITFIDTGSSFNDRMLAPIFPFVLIVIALIFIEYTSHQKFNKFIVTGILIFMVGTNTCWFLRYHYNFYLNGKGYSGKIWYNSEILQKIKNIEGDIIYYTNGKDVMNYHLPHLSKKTFSLPELHDPKSLIKNELYNTQLGEMSACIEYENCVLIYFNNFTYRVYLPSQEQILDVYKNINALELDDGFIISRSDLFTFQH